MKSQKVINFNRHINETGSGDCRRGRKYGRIAKIRAPAAQRPPDSSPLRSVWDAYFGPDFYCTYHN